MPKKIIHRAHGESPKAFLNRRTFAAIFTQIGENKIACANQQMDRERIAFKKPHPDRRIHQPDECSSAILVNCDANRSGVQIRWSWSCQFFPSRLALLFGHGLRDYAKRAIIEKLWQNATPIRRLWSRSKKRPNPSRFLVKSFSNPRSCSSNYARPKNANQRDRSQIARRWSSRPEKFFPRFFARSTFSALPHVGFLACDQSDGEHGAPWYFAKVGEALLAFIDARAQQLRSRLAETEVTKEIRLWFAKSRRMQKSIMFIGNSRFGKTETVEVEAIADPGRCRLVNTPASNAMSDLLREVAKSLGIEVGPGTSGRDLRDLIDYVLRFSHLQLIFDECQFLIEQNYSRNTAPARLNWVRRSIMDQGSPVVFVCTPQSYEPAKNRFVRATGFAMEQFDKRFYSVNIAATSTKRICKRSWAPCSQLRAISWATWR